MFQECITSETQINLCDFTELMTAEAVYKNKGAKQGSIEQFHERTTFGFQKNLAKNHEKNHFVNKVYKCGGVPTLEAI